MTCLALIHQKFHCILLKTDTAVITNTMATLNRKIVSADIYKVLLSPNEYVRLQRHFFASPFR